MKKKLAILLVLSILFTLIAACATEQPTEPTPAPAATQPTEPPSAPETTQPTEPPPDSTDTQPEEPVEIIVTDQLGRDVLIPETVSSVAVSHGPMLALVVALGGGDLVVGTGPKASGRTIYEVVAPNVIEAPQIGQQANLNLEELANISPDLFILSARNRDMLPDLDMLGIAGVAVDPENFETIITSMRIIGAAIQNTEHVENIIQLFEQRLAWTRERAAQVTHNPTALLFGRGVTEVAAANMIQADLLEIAGAINLASDVEGTSYVDVGIEQVLLWNPEYIFISAWGPLQPEDFFDEPRLAEVTAVRDGNVFKIPSDAEWWDTPSVVTVLGAIWVTHMIHPDLITAEELDYAVEEFYYLLHGIRLGRAYFGY